MSGIIALVVALGLAQSGTAVSGQQASMSREETRAKVTADLATRLRVPVKEIRVAAESNRTWPDETLGCGGRKGLYEPSPVPGFAFTLTHANRRFEYHTDTHGRIRRCDHKKTAGPIG